MALTGELSDLSLAELIEFFCNQRKTGRIEVKYPIAPASFYLQSGAVVHAEIGSLRGIEAVYFSLTQANASFTFNSAVEPPTQSINQPWTSVVLEGLRRMDEGIAPSIPVPNQPAPEIVEEQPIDELIAVESLPEVEPVAPPPVVKVQPDFVVPPVRILDVESDPIEAAREESKVEPVAANSIPEAPLPEAEPLQAEPVHAEPKPVEQPKPEKAKRKEPEPSMDVQPAGILAYHPPKVVPPPQVSPIFADVTGGRSFAYGPWKLGVIFGAVVLVIAVVAVPWGWYARSKAAKASPEAQTVTNDSPQPSVSVNSTQDSPAATQTQPAQATDQVAQSAAAPSNSENRQPRPNQEAKLKPKTNDSTLGKTNGQTPAAAVNPAAVNPQPTSNATRKVSVQVTYDENGRVTQASGGDATALRIARQKRFPAGKAGSTTITIPIN